MSTSSESGGRPSAAVFRRRRIVVGVGILAVLIAIVLIFVRPGSANENAVGPTTTPPATTADGSAAPDATPTPTVEPGGPCDPDTILVVAETDEVSYDAGAPVSMTMTVTNTGPVSCELNVGTAAQVFTVTSGTEKYWTSTDCQTDPADSKVLLDPGVPASSTTPVVWDRTRSEPDNCEAERVPAPAGGASYHLTVGIDGIESERTQFLLY